MAGFSRFRYLAADDADVGASRPATAFRSTTGELVTVGAPDAVPPLSFSSDDRAARFYLDQIIGDDSVPALRSIDDPSEPPRAPGFVHESTSTHRVNATRVVRYRQETRQLPVFGGGAVVELSADRSLIAIDARVAEPPADLTREPVLDAAEAQQIALRDAGTSGAAGPEPTLELYFDDESETWHLVWHVHDVPGMPDEARPDNEAMTHRIGGQFRSERVRTDYLVDAHTGEVVYYYGVAPTLDRPSACSGIDEDGNPVRFLGHERSGQFALYDPFRGVRTFDLQLGDLNRVPVPTAEVISPQAEFAATFKAAVTAHRHGSMVQDFYKSVLQRDGIDDQGMDLQSIVNCTDPASGTPPQWINACWWQGRMWYGQLSDASGQLVSLSRYLDVIAHEITHGVIETTSNLVYRDESGALNESFADIFGVIIANINRAPIPDDVSTWDWEIGAGLGGNGGPLRHFADPASIGDPAHWRDRYQGTADYGGVHTNSNIHNKAIYELLVAKDAAGAPVLTVTEASILLYLTLVSLLSSASFADARAELTAVAKTYFAGDPNRQAAVTTAIDDAYDHVGIV
jgi:bacillolysin/neutral peptidase B